MCCVIDWNICNPDVKRHCFEPPPIQTVAYTPLAPIRINQHSAPLDHIGVIYHRLMSSSIRISNIREQFECWIIPKDRPGYDQMPSGYTRFSFQGKKLMTHRFTWLYNNPGQAITLDISHLCGNASCHRPEHLVHESRADNIDRRGCKAWAIGYHSDLLIRLCRHTPLCKTAVLFDEDYDLLDDFSPLPSSL